MTWGVPIDRLPLWGVGPDWPDVYSLVREIQEAFAADEKADRAASARMIDRLSGFSRGSGTT